MLEYVTPLYRCQIRYGSIEASERIQCASFAQCTSSTTTCKKKLFSCMSNFICKPFHNLMLKQNISAFQVTFILKTSTPNFEQTFGMWAKKLLSTAQSHDAGGKMTLHGNKAHCILKPTQNQQSFVAILRGFPLVVLTFKVDPTSGPSTSSPAGRELQNNDKIIQELPGCCPKHSTAWKQQTFNSRCSPHSSHFISLTSV